MTLWLGWTDFSLSEQSPGRRISDQKLHHLGLQQEIDGTLKQLIGKSLMNGLFSEIGAGLRKQARDEKAPGE